MVEYQYSSLHLYAIARSKIGLARIGCRLSCALILVDMAAGRARPNSKLLQHKDCDHHCTLRLRGRYDQIYRFLRVFRDVAG